MINAMKMTVGALNDLRCEDKLYKPYLKKPSSCVVKPTFRSQNCHVRDASPDDSVDQRQHTLGRLLLPAVSSFRLWTRHGSQPAEGEI